MVKGREKGGRGGRQGERDAIFGLVVRLYREARREEQRMRDYHSTSLTVQTAGRSAESEEAGDRKGVLKGYKRK